MALAASIWFTSVCTVDWTWKAVFGHYKHVSLNKGDCCLQDGEISSTAMVQYRNHVLS